LRKSARDGRVDVRMWMDRQTDRRMDGVQRLIWCCVADSEDVAADNSEEMGCISKQFYTGQYWLESLTLAAFLGVNLGFWLLKFSFFHPPSLWCRHASWRPLGQTLSYFPSIVLSLSAFIVVHIKNGIANNISVESIVFDLMLLPYC